MRACVLLVDGQDGQVIGGGVKFGITSDITTYFIAFAGSDADPWIGFLMQFPIGNDNEDLGLGMIHKLRNDVGEFGGPVPADMYTIEGSASSQRVPDSGKPLP
ncbi:hypothetical protein G6O67_005231 [Ophiocordyceps sinensis]|uniref:Uncharacterized protein n=1 Tax=Ophiocordyceps sinensis TaxID=72228 RepID=A0A8H4PR60_9HYPO|nr:hypothetical protein G6O67_005231 [Ophiocordyceps sinensis]